MISALKIEADRPLNIDRAGLEAYATWLFYERRILCYELWPGVMHADALVLENGATDFHFTGSGPTWTDRPMPSTRAAAVLSAVGFDWQTMRRPKQDLMAAARLRPPRPTPAGFPTADGALLDAERRHAELMEAINSGGIGDEQVGRIAGETQIVEDAIENSPAESFQGMQAKARVLRRLMVGDDSYRITCPEGADDIGRLTWSLIRDILGDWSPVDHAMAPEAV